MEEREVSVICVGNETKNVGVLEETTIGQAIQYAGYEEFEGTVYVKDESGTTQVVSLTDKVNGYEKIILSTNVKGGI